MQLSERQGLGTCQIDGERILIIGGYTGQFNADSFYLNIKKQTMARTRGPMPQDCFPFAVPTVSDCEREIAFTVDWSKYRLFRHEN